MSHISNILVSMLGFCSLFAVPTNDRVPADTLRENTTEEEITEETRQSAVYARLVNMTKNMALFDTPKEREEKEKTKEEKEKTKQEKEKTKQEEEKRKQEENNHRF